MADDRLPKTVLVGITGRFGRGKTTLAELIAALIPGARVVAFGDALKLQVAQVVAMNTAMGDTVEVRAWLDRHKGDVFGPLLQGWAELRRQWNDQDYWIARLEAGLPDRAIVHDVRYPNEAGWILRRGGLLVGIEGPNRREGDQRSDDHASERQVEALIERADITVKNTAGLDWLERTAQIVVDELRMRAIKAAGQARDEASRP